MEHDKRVKVWDLFVRIFHWSLVTSFVVAYVTEEDVLSIHPGRLRRARPDRSAPGLGFYRDAARTVC